MIARLASPIGWPAGQSQRRHGVVPTRERVAHKALEDAPELCCLLRGGCVTSSEPYDCQAGFANWMAGWSVAKKAWCCSNKGKGCPAAAGGCERKLQPGGSGSGGGGR